MPRFVYFQHLGLYDSLWALILPGMFTVLGTFLMRQFFVSQPGEFAEAARIDGANELQIFWRIYLPNALPMISALAILTFVWSWNDYETPLVFLSTPETYTLPLALTNFTDETGAMAPGILDGRSGHLDHPDPGGVPDLPAPLRSGHDRERPEVTRTDPSAPPPTDCPPASPNATTSRSTPPMPSLETVSGVAPSLAQIGDFGPPRSELGVGALMPYNGALYVQNYNSHRAETGTGVSLRRIEGDFSMQKVPEVLDVDGTYTNRFVHFETGLLVIGPHVIEPDHSVHTVDELAEHRLCGTARHLTRPETHVYVLTMEGLVYEFEPAARHAALVWDLNEELATEGEMKVHYKDCYTAHGRLVVCSNEYGEDDWAGTPEPRPPRGVRRIRVARSSSASRYTAISGRGDFTDTIFATGWDAGLGDPRGVHRTRRHLDPLPPAEGLPHLRPQMADGMAPHPRDRARTSPDGPPRHVLRTLPLGVRRAGSGGCAPISTHLWVLGDFCSWKGMLVLGADNASPSQGQNVTTAEPQSGLWFGKTDDLWGFGKPKWLGRPLVARRGARRQAVGSVPDDWFRQQVPAPGEPRGGG